MTAFQTALELEIERAEWDILFDVYSQSWFGETISRPYAWACVVDTLGGFR